ncbi:MAG: hypothetical protein WDM85_07275 [Caulobacteraceae bacterium]
MRNVLLKQVGRVVPLHRDAVLLLVVGDVNCTVSGPAPEANRDCISREIQGLCAQIC